MAFPTIYHHNHNTLGGGARTKLAVFLCANKYPPPPVAGLTGLATDD